MRCHPLSAAKWPGARSRNSASRTNRAEHRTQNTGPPSVRRADKQAALTRLRSRRGDSGRENDLAVQGEANEGGRLREAHRGIRGASPRQGLRVPERADRGRDGRLRSPPEDDGRGEGQGEEGRESPADLGQAGTSKNP